MMFDLDGSGSIEAHELLSLGQATLVGDGQVVGLWTDAQHAALMAKLDQDKDGEVRLPVSALSRSLAARVCCNLAVCALSWQPC